MVMMKKSRNKSRKGSDKYLNKIPNNLYYGIGLFIVFLVGLLWLLSKDSKNLPSTAPNSVRIVRHDASFNSSVDKIMNAYFIMHNAFVEADTILIKKSMPELLKALDGFSAQDVAKENKSITETVAQQVRDIRLNAASIGNQTDITEMRQDFRMVNESLYPFLKSIGYEGNTLYLQHCPMAFGENTGADWISNSVKIVNPYLGKNHPEYKSTMLHCGELVDSIIK